MILKEIELYGFKSFGKRTVINFSDNLTGIVGPNGSGKSNIAEAVRWVLGEQRVKPLRSEKMEDVIFSGTDQKKPLGYAQVTIVLDNSSRIFPADYDELEVSRRLYRTGESEFSINKTPCRLKDVQELFSDTGLGREGYSIIGQGQIESLVTNSPASVKLLIDEAAGIVKYRSRRQEAERKLERAENNSLRINDILSELSERLPRLKKQSEKAEKYVLLKNELREKEIGVFTARMDILGEKSRKAGQNIESLQESLDNADRELSEYDEQFRRDRFALSECEIRIEAANDDVKRILSEYEDAKVASSVAQSRLAGIDDSIKEARAEAETYQDTMSLLENEREGLIAEYRELKADTEAMTREFEAYMEKVNAVSSELRDEQSRLTALEGYESSMQGYNYAIRELMRAREKDDYLSDNVHTTVGEAVSTESRYVSAISEALGASANNIITSDEKAASRCIDILNRNSWGRVTFLPISIIRASDNSDIKSTLKGMPGYISCADELVKTKDEYRAIVSSILSRTAVFEDLKTANEAARKSNYRFRMATLRGEMLYAGGAIAGGRQKNDSTPLKRRDEISRLKKKVASLKEEYDSLIKENQSDISETISANREALAAKAERINSSKERIDYFLDALNKQKAKADKLIDEKKTLQETAEHSSDNNDSYEKKRSEAEKLYKSLVAEKEKLTASYGRLNEEIITANKDRSEISERLVKARAEKASYDEEMIRLTSDMMEDYSLTYADAVSYSYASQDISASLAEIAGLKEAIKRLGNINVDSLEEFRLERERFEKMSAQRDDIAKSIDEMHKVISEISQGMEKRFNNEFSAINAQFDKVFRELFGGGEASISVIDPQDVLNSGIDISARPPHTRKRNISLLSGGEKSMTAIALIFAILSLKPAPFCLLDEADAALDDANIIRFREYLKRYSEKDQFIIVTHKKLTMEAAESLYGVSKGQDGISQVVSIKLSETDTYGD